MRNVFLLLIWGSIIATQTVLAEENTNNKFQDPQYYIELANEFEKNDVDYAKQALSRALNALAKQPNKAQEFQVLIKLASLEQSQKNYLESQKYLTEAKLLRDIVNQQLTQANEKQQKNSLDFNLLLADVKLFQIEAEILHSQKKYDEAIYLLEEALSIVEQTGNNPGLLHQLFSMRGDAYLKIKKYKFALTSYLLAQHHIHTQSDEIKVKLWGDIAFLYTRLNDYYSAIKYFKRALALIEKSNLVPLQEVDYIVPPKARVLLDISRSYKKVGSFKEALTFGNKALAVAKETKNEEFTLKSLLHLSITYRRLSSYDNALEHGLEALNIYRKNNDLNGIASSYNAIGLIYNRLDHREKAKVYFEKVTQIPKDKIKDKYYAAALRELALYNFYQKNYAIALELNEKTFLIYEQLKNLGGKATVKKNLGLIYHATGEVELAFEAFRFAVEATKQSGDVWEQATNLANIALLYAQEQPQKTVEWANKGLRLAKRIQAKPVLEQLYLALTIAEEKRKNFQQALVYSKLRSVTLNEIKIDTVSRHTHEMHALKNVINKMYEIDALKEKMSVISDKFFAQKNSLAVLNNKSNSDDTMIQNLQLVIFILLSFIIFFIVKLKKLMRR